MNLYVLNEDGLPVRVASHAFWRLWADTAAARRQRRLKTEVLSDGVRVETFFAPSDNAAMPCAHPMLWKTTITGGRRNGSFWQASSIWAANCAHYDAVKTAKAGVS